MNAIQKAIINYNKACNDMLDKCIVILFWEDPDVTEKWWVAGDIGGVASVNDYFIDMQTITDILQLRAEQKETDIPDLFFSWYDYCTRWRRLGVDSPNFKSWANGCPRRSQADYDRIISLQEQLDKLIEDENNKENSESN